MKVKIRNEREIILRKLKALLDTDPIGEWDFVMGIMQRTDNLRDTTYQQRIALIRGLSDILSSYYLS